MHPQPATAAQPAGIRSGTCWNLGMAKMALAKSGEFSHFTQNGNLATEKLWLNLF